MFERLTDDGREVVTDSLVEAMSLDHGTIKTGHLLLALIRSGDSAAAAALSELGMSLNLTREQVAAVYGSVNEPRGNHIPFTAQARRVLDLALMEANRLKSHPVGPEHVLLGLLRLCDSDDRLDVTAVLRVFGVSTDDVRRQVVKHMVIQANA